MKIKFTFSLGFIIISMMLLLFINSSCRKEYIQRPVTIDSIPQEQNSKISQQFFNKHLSNDENINAIRNNILTQNQKNHLLKNL